MFDLSGKIAIITGGNQSIGFAIAQGLAKAGAHAIIANRRIDEGDKAASLIKSEGYAATAIPTDVSSITAISRLVNTVVDKFGKIDILVNNAGVMVRKPILDIEELDWNYLMDINLKGMFFCCQLVGKEMIKNKKGRIINLSSLRSQKMAPNRSIYAISKAGISNLTRAFAYEWGKFNITVNAIAPGTIATEFNRKHFEEHPDEFNEIIKSIPVGRVGNPLDCISTALFLASDESGFITGQTIFTDGGTSIC